MPCTPKPLDPPALPRERRRLLLLSACTAALAACGGGDSQPASAAPPPPPSPPPPPPPPPPPTHGRFGFAVGTQGTSMHLGSVREDGSDYRELTLPGVRSMVETAWAPNGARIAFVTQDYSQGWERQQSVWVVNADGSDLRFIDYGLNPSWNADGTQLAYVFKELSGTRSWLGLGALNVVTGQGVFGNQPGRGNDAIGTLPSSAGIERPRWAGNQMVWADYRSTTAGVTTFALKRYLGYPGTLVSERTPSDADLLAGDPAHFILNDFATQGDLGLVLEGLGNSGESRLSWLYPDGSRRTLKQRTRSGGGRFSPDGLRLWINLDDGRGARFVLRDLSDAGAPGPLPTPAGGGYSWFQSA